MYQLSLFHSWVAQKNLISKSVIQKRYNLQNTSVCKNIINNFRQLPEILDVSYSRTHTGTQIVNFTSLGLPYILVCKKHSALQETLLHNLFPSV